MWRFAFWKLLSVQNCCLLNFTYVRACAYERVCVRAPACVDSTEHQKALLTPFPVEKESENFVKKRERMKHCRAYLAHVLFNDKFHKILS